MDSSRFFDSFRGPSIEGAFDCVVSDPPYGVRAGARCAGKDGAVKPVPDELRREHVPATKPYATADVLCDLLEIAARCLKQGGRLAYLLPATNDLTPEDVPRHPALTLVACEPQQLSTKYARWLVVMVKGTGPRATGRPRSAPASGAADGALRRAEGRSRGRRRRPRQTRTPGSSTPRE